MKRTYFSFFALLLVAFMLFAGLSFFKDGIEESFGINTATFASDLLSTPGDELELADVVPPWSEPHSTPPKKTFCS